MRTAVPLKEKRLVKTIKNGADKTMPPNPMGAAPRTFFGPGPWIVPPLFRKFLENYREKE
jgi:hypothetical protein